MWPMKPTPEEIARDRALIDALGGPAAVAKELGLPAASGVQTVQNWKGRGIPPRHKLRRPDLFQRPARPARARKAA